MSQSAKWDGRELEFSPHKLNPVTSVAHYGVDVGVVEYNYKTEDKKSLRAQLEVDFIANRDSRRCYIQSALTVADEEKRKQETHSLYRIDDSFKKSLR